MTDGAASDSSRVDACRADDFTSAEQVRLHAQGRKLPACEQYEPQARSLRHVFFGPCLPDKRSAAQGNSERRSCYNRRAFLGATVAGGALAVVPRHVLGGPRFVPPSEKITVGYIGIGTQGIREMGDMLADSEIQIVAVCDPNRDSNDYVEWGKFGILRTIRRYLDDPSWREGETGCPGGREVGRVIVDSYYGRQRGRASFRACTAYADFREMLDKEKDLDAVKIMTPDHLHATIALAALKKGKHVAMHKPIANRLYEGRLVVQAAQETQLATHLLAYGSGYGNRYIARHIQEGAIGTLHEIHNWTNRPVWPQYTEIPRETPPVPEGFDWQLWLGPAVDRPYHPHYTHTVFRGWYDFGGGSMADMGIYSLWPVFTELNLSPPSAAQAWATHTCAIVDHVSRPVKNDFSYPTGCTIRIRVPRKDGRGDVELFWYDGGMKPRLPGFIEAHDVAMGREGILFVGDEGAIMAGFHGDRPELFSGTERRPLWQEPPYEKDEERALMSRRGRHAPWVAACRGEKPSPGNFPAAAAITDTVNLGTVALRAGEKVVFDSEQMKITNVDRANRYLRRQYRPGWEL